MSGCQPDTCQPDMSHTKVDRRTHACTGVVKANPIAGVLAGHPHQPVACDQIAFFGFLGLDWSSLESGDLWYKSQVAKETIWSIVEGAHGDAGRAREHLRLDVTVNCISQNG